MADSNDIDQRRRAASPRAVPNNLRGGEETFPQFDLEAQSQIRLLGLQDPNAARAKELELAGDVKRAKRVLSCENPDPTQPYWRCRVRGCPRCSARTESRYRKKAAAAMRQMHRRLVVLVSLCSVGAGVESLKRTISQIGKRFDRLKRRKCFRAVRGGVGGREVQLTHDDGRWNVHLHLVLDVPPDEFDVAEVDRVWRKMTNSLGSVRLHEDPEVKSIDRMASYVTKHSTWSPPPGQMNPWLLADILKGVKGRRLFLCWGSAKEGAAEAASSMSAPVVVAQIGCTTADHAEAVGGAKPAGSCGAGHRDGLARDWLISPLPDAREQ